jgi:hypothetical protein
MIRGGSSLGRIGCLLVCALATLAATVPATAGAQSPAVDEYTLDIPGGGGGSQSGDPGSPPPTGAEASGSSGGGGGATGDGNVDGGGGAGGGDEDAGGESRGGSGHSARYENLQDDVGGSDGSSGTTRPLDTSSRSAPEVVADSLTDGGMLPLIAALAVITGVGAWRVLRHRRTLTRAPG